MSCDIIATVAWQCGESDCGSPGGWHTSNYWCDTDSDTGYTVDTYSDGDHETVDESDVPTYDEVKKSWREYSEWVAEHGDDPLGEFFIDQPPERKFVATFGDSILGIMLLRVRTGSGRHVSMLKLPAQVIEYLTVKGTGGNGGQPYIQQDWKNLAEVRDAMSQSPDFKFRKRHLIVSFSVRIPHTEKKRASLLRAAAKKHLAQP